MKRKTDSAPTIRNVAVSTAAQKKSRTAHSPRSLAPPITSSMDISNHNNVDDDDEVIDDDESDRELISSSPKSNNSANRDRMAMSSEKENSDIGSDLDDDNIEDDENGSQTSTDLAATTQKQQPPQPKQQQQQQQQKKRESPPPPPQKSTQKQQQQQQQQQLQQKKKKKKKQPPQRKDGPTIPAENTPLGAFMGVLMTGGFRFSSTEEDGDSSAMSESNSYFVEDPIKLRKHLEKRLSHNDQLRDLFAQGFAEHISDESALKKCLEPCSSNVIYSTHDSLCRMLLNVTPLQTSIMNYLFEKLPELADSTTENEKLSKQVLSQFRWLDIVVNSAKMTEKIFEVLEVCPLDLQKDIISFLPEVIDDKEHRRVIESLREKMMENKEYTVAVLDALANMNLNDELLTTIFDFVLQSLDSAKVDDLPVVIRFLLQSATEETAPHIVEQLRKKLDFASLIDDNAAAEDRGHGNMSDMDDDDQVFLSIASSKGKKKSKSKKVIRKEQRQGEALILESIKTGMRYKKEITTAFLKEIAKIDEPDKHKIIDFWVLLIIFSMANTKKSALALLRKKITNGLFTITLLKESMVNHAEALDAYFTPMLTLSGLFLRQHSNHTLAKFGQTMYYLLFTVFTSDFHRTEIMSQIIAHFGSGVPNEIDSSLDILLALVQSYLSSVRSLKNMHSMLDYLEGLNDYQLRKLYRFFAYLSLAKEQQCGHAQLMDFDDYFANGNGDDNNNNNANGNGGSNNSYVNELFIIVRKQLSNGSAKYKKMGIIGACSILGIIGSVVSRTLSTSFGTFGKVVEEEMMAESRISLSGEDFATAVGLLESALSNCSKLPFCVSMLYDELSAVIGQRPLDQRMIKKISDDKLPEFVTVALEHREDLERNLIEGGGGGGNNHENNRGALQRLTNIKSEKWMDLEGNEFENAIKILPILMSEDSHAFDRLWNMLALFRLLQTCEKRSEDNSGIMADMLGAPLIMFRQETLQDFETLSPAEKDLVCSALFGAINWIRELLNAFCRVEKASMKGKILERLNHLIEVERLLDKCLASYPRFSLPNGEDTTNQKAIEPDKDKKSPAVTAATKKPKEKKKKKKKKKKADTKKKSASKKTKAAKKKKKKAKNAEDADEDEGQEEEPEEDEEEEEPEEEQEEEEEEEEEPEEEEDEDEDEDEEDDAANDSSKGTKPSKKPKKKDSDGVRFEELARLRPHMRELDVDVISLFTFAGLNFNKPGTQQALIMTSSACYYLLQDLQWKLQILIAGGKKIRFFASANQNQIASDFLKRMSVEDLLKVVQPVLPSICAYAERFVSLLPSPLDDDEDEDDDEEKAKKKKKRKKKKKKNVGDGSTDEAEGDEEEEKEDGNDNDNDDKEDDDDDDEPVYDKYLVPCLTLIFDIIRRVLIAPVHADQAAGKQKFEDVLSLICNSVAKSDDDAEPASQEDEPDVYTTAFGYFEKFMGRISLFELANKLINVLVAILHHVPKHELNQRLSNVALGLLKRHWNIKMKALSLQHVLTIHIRRAESPIAAIEAMMKHLEAFVADPAHLTSEELPTLNKETFPTFYKTILVEISKCLIDFDMSTTDPTAVRNGLHTIERCIKVFKAQMSMIKDYPNSRQHMHKHALQCSRQFCDNYLKVVTSFMMKNAKAHKKKVINIITALQPGTRTLQYLCADVKDAKSVQLSALVPFVKKALETIIFKSKQILTDLDCLKDLGFSIGVLKNRNAAGMSVPSQRSCDDAGGGGDDATTTTKKKKKKRTATTRKKAAASTTTDDDDDDDDVNNDGDGKKRRKKRAPSTTTAAKKKKATTTDDEEEDQESEKQQQQHHSDLDSEHEYAADKSGHEDEEEEIEEHDTNACEEEF